MGLSVFGASACVSFVRLLFPDGDQPNAKYDGYICLGEVQVQCPGVTPKLVSIEARFGKIEVDVAHPGAGGTVPPQPRRQAQCPTLAGAAACRGLSRIPGGKRHAPLGAGRVTPTWSAKIKSATKAGGPLPSMSMSPRRLASPCCKSPA